MVCQDANAADLYVVSIVFVGTVGLYQCSRSRRMFKVQGLEFVVELSRIELANQRKIVQFYQNVNQSINFYK